MTLRNRLLLGVCAAAGVACSSLFWLKTDRAISTTSASTPLTDVARKSGGASGSVALNAPAGVVTSHAAPSVGDATLGSGKTAPLNWRNALSQRDSKWVIEQLSISDDPNDRVRAWALTFVCGELVHRPFEALKGRLIELKKTTEQQREISRMYEDALVRCGAPEQGRYYVGSSAMPQGLKTARASGVPLAVALDIHIPGLRQSGMTDAEAAALSAVLRDETLRSAWLIIASISTFGQDLTTAPAFAGSSARELSAALIAVLCRSGDDCGTDSLYRPYLCFITSFQFCSGATVESAIAGGLSPDATVRFENATRQLQAAMTAGDLSALGFGKRIP